VPIAIRRAIPVLLLIYLALLCAVQVMLTTTAIAEQQSRSEEFERVGELQSPMNQVLVMGTRSSRPLGKDNLKRLSPTQHKPPLPSRRIHRFS